MGLAPKCTSSVKQPLRKCLGQPERYVVEQVTAKQFVSAQLSMAAASWNSYWWKLNPNAHLQSRSHSGQCLSKPDPHLAEQVAAKQFVSARLPKADASWSIPERYVFEQVTAKQPVSTRLQKAAASWNIPPRASCTHCAASVKKPPSKVRLSQAAASWNIPLCGSCTQMQTFSQGAPPSKVPAQTRAALRRTSHCKTTCLSTALEGCCVMELFSAWQLHQSAQLSPEATPRAAPANQDATSSSKSLQNNLSQHGCRRPLCHGIFLCVAVVPNAQLQSRNPSRKCGTRRMLRHGIFLCVDVAPNAQLQSRSPSRKCGTRRLLRHGIFLCVEVAPKCTPSVKKPLSQVPEPPRAAHRRASHC